MRRPTNSHAAYRESNSLGDSPQVAKHPQSSKPTYRQSSFFDVPDSYQEPSEGEKKTPNYTAKRVLPPRRSVGVKHDYEALGPAPRKGKKRPRRIDIVTLTEVVAVIESLDLQPILSQIKPAYRTGRRGYDLKAMLTAHLCRYVLDIQYVSDWVAELGFSSQLAKICGFKGHTPGESTFSRFNALLSKIPSILSSLMHQISDEVKRRIDKLHAQDPVRYPEYGKEVAIDATAVKAYSNPNKWHGRHRYVSDKDASLGWRHKADSLNDPMVRFFGYKVHAIGDANYDLPLVFDVATGRSHDNNFLRPLYEQARDNHSWFKPDVVLGDKGYDSKALHRFLRKQGTTGVIPIRKTTSKDGLFDGIYDENGDPTCMGGVAMQYLGTNPANQKLIWQCRTQGCHLKQGGTRAITHCDTKVELDPDDNPRVMGAIPRNTKRWKRLYRKRWSIERVFASWKHSRLLENHHYRGLPKVRTHVIASGVAFLATVLAHLRQEKPEFMAWMKVRRA